MGDCPLAPCAVAEHDQTQGRAASRPSPLPLIPRDYVALNFITLMASKFCTPPPTRLVV